MSVRNLGYWLGEQDAEMRRRHYLPPYSAAKPMVLRDMTTAPVFYPSLEDLEVLRSELGTDHHRAVVFSPCAGLPDRDIPAPIVEKLALMTVEAGFVPVFVGRTYDRFERGERWRSGVPDGCVNLIDRLSVPGVAALAQATLGSVCCHSAVSMLGWYLRKPQLLLYPQSVVERHFTNRDQWSFGLSFQECFHECFEEATWEVQADAFLDFLTQRSATTKKETAH
jgi:ADP-heptose:LPS heptosyltransferase